VSPHSIFHLIVLLSPDAFALWAAAGMSLHFQLEWEDWIRMLYTVGLF
jgi:hypothetical protein